LLQVDLGILGHSWPSVPSAGEAFQYFSFFSGRGVAEELAQVLLPAGTGQEKGRLVWELHPYYVIGILVE
jgi:hypothetical protein